MSQSTLSPNTQNRPSPPAHWNETDPFLALRRGMDRLLEQVSSGWGLPAAPFAAPAFATGITPPRLNVAETQAGLEVTAELPGLDAKDVTIEVEDGVLTIRGDRHDTREEADPQKRWHLVERASGTFLRRLALPFDPAPDQVLASFDKGVLHLSIPRPPTARPQAKRIEIKAAGSG